VRAALAEVGPVVTVSRDGDRADVCADLSTVAPDRLAALIRSASPDAVVNCAGVTDGTPPEQVAGNVVAVAALVAAWERAAPAARLVHLGSAAEYGGGPAERPVGEDAPTRPVSSYGVTKLAGTALVRAAADRGRPATVLRVFNPLGPGTPTSLLPGRLVERLRLAAVTGERATSGPLDGHRDFVDARDVASAVLAAATASVPVPDVLNVAAGRAVALRDLAETAARLAGVAPPVESRPEASARSATVTWQQADVRRIGATLGWTPAIALEQSLVDMFAGYAVRAS
jgi:nucleoside-diphosphate-sugar epimerase